MSRLVTKRFILSMLGLFLGSFLCYKQRLPGEAWVYALAVILAGHHAVDLIKAWRGTSDPKTGN